MSAGPATTVAPAPLNGASHPAPPAGGNRKKQKRRAREAAKQEARRQEEDGARAHAALQHQTPSALSSPPVHAPPPEPGQPAPEYADDDRYEDEGEFYSEDDEEHYVHDYPLAPNGHPATSYADAPPARADRPSRKKKRGSFTAFQSPLDHHMPLRKPSTPVPSSSRSKHKDDDPIWDTEHDEERERIREFWLSLGEEERKALVKIEKEAVLKKMKEQQKQSCSCTVCGRKRTAIEEELEVLYDAYYEELEQYANHQQDGGPILPPVRYPHPRHRSPHHRFMNTHPPVEQYDDDGVEYSDESEAEDDDDYSNSEISSDDAYSSEGRMSLPPEHSDFLQFGNSLQVKGGILTVADDLLKNDGKKFIEMMEQLAERRMQREQDAELRDHSSTYGRSHPSHSHMQPDEDDYDDAEDDEDYEDDDYEEEEEDENDTMTEEQRMEEGRRMFQIFAARMFEQRVLQAYKEKVAAERQQKLLEELRKEEDLEEQARLRKEKEAQKRREKKEQQRQRKAEKEAQKEAQKAAREAAAKAEKEKRLEEERKRKEEDRKKREAERKAEEEEKQRKQAERLKRQQEERERKQEQERKQRELKAQEKKAKEETRRKEREEREAREKEAREKKAQEDKERRERDAKARADRERLRKEEQAAAAAKKAAQAGPVPLLPPQLLKQTSGGIPSPHITPALPKAPTPNRPRQSSQQGSHGSSPKTPHVAPGTGTSKSISPVSQAQNPIAPKSILAKPPTSQQHPFHHGQPTMAPIGPPPGMHGHPAMGLGMPPGLNGFPHPQSPMMLHGMLPRHSVPHPNIPFATPSGPQTYRGFAPPGVHGPAPLPLGRGFPMDVPPGFGSMPTPFGGPNQIPGFGMGMPSHSRQASGSFDKAESPVVTSSAQPIQRPTPIGRPSSTKPGEESKVSQLSDVDEVADHLGSKALLEDAIDDAEEGTPIEPRRTSLQPPGLIRTGSLGFGFSNIPEPNAVPFATFGSAPSGGGIWGAPTTMSSAFPLPRAQPGWGNSPTTSSMFTNSNPFHAPRPMEPPITLLRKRLCAMCKSKNHPTSADGFVDVSDMEQILQKALHADHPITKAEIKTACEIIGDRDNGGGTLEYKESPQGTISHIKFVEDSGLSNNTLGEIGSPVPEQSHPVHRPFPW